MIFYEDNHLGGCTREIDPATFYPKMWDFFIKNFNIKSVFDLGCGTGHSLAVFKEYCHSKGVDGCKEAIQNSVVKDDISLHDFVDGEFDPLEEFDMVWCCEFVEHIEDVYKDNFLKTIKNTNANYILMTHAVPGQGGYHHVNCRSSSYWIMQMEKYGYALSPQITRMLRTIAAFECSAESNHFFHHGLVFVKKEVKIKAKDAIITWCSGKEFCKNPGIKVFVNSIKSSNTNADKFVFTHDMEMEDREYFSNEGFEVIDCNPDEIQLVVRDRFYVWSKYLFKNDYRYVALLDCKDVIIQSNPFEFLEKKPEKKLFFIGEGKKHKDCEWNTQDQIKLQQNTKNFKLDFNDWEVICAGTILGYSQDVRELIKQIWSTTLMSNTPCSDQSVLNFLYNLFYKEKYFELADPTVYNLCATADLPHENQPYMADGFLYHNSLKEKYFLFHQWDRTKYKLELLEKYK